MGTPWVQLRTKEQIARVIRKEGGVIEVYLKLDDVGSHNFGRIRERCCEGGDADDLNLFPIFRFSEIFRLLVDRSIIRKLYLRLKRPIPL
jgi:hypothetical protein